MGDTFKKVSERVECDVIEGVLSAFTGADLSRRVGTYEDDEGNRIEVTGKTEEIRGEKISEGKYRKV
jgi:hypothetical protein